MHKTLRQKRWPVDAQWLAGAPVAVPIAVYTAIAEHKPVGRPRRKLIVLAARAEVLDSSLSLVSQAPPLSDIIGICICGKLQRTDFQ
jgi:hypothetical protein